MTFILIAFITVLLFIFIFSFNFFKSIFSLKILVILSIFSNDISVLSVGIMVLSVCCIILCMRFSVTLFFYLHIKDLLLQFITMYGILSV